MVDEKLGGDGVESATDSGAEQLNRLVYEIAMENTDGLLGEQLLFSKALGVIDQMKSSGQHDPALLARLEQVYSEKVAQDGEENAQKPVAERDLDAQVERVNPADVLNGKPVGRLDGKENLVTSTMQQPAKGAVATVVKPADLPKVGKITGEPPRPGEKGLAR